MQTLNIFKALSDRNRLRIVKALQQYEELCACQITELLQVTGATVSRHLGILQQAGILESRKEGRWVYYRLLPPGDAAPLFQWLEHALEDSGQLRADTVELDKIVGMERETLCRIQRGEKCCPRA